MLRLERCLGFAAAAVGLWGVVTGCGSDGGKASSYSSITEEISKPTGTVDQASVAKIGEKFEAASKASAMGVRDDDQTAASGSATVTQNCPSGGSFSATGSGNESNGRGTVKYNDCCYTAGCCADGNATIYYSSAQSSAFTYCANYDMDTTCAGTSLSIEYSGCLSASGMVLLIDVDGASYAVTGSRSNGTGSLEITGANGKWSCTFSSGSGSCTSSAGGNFSFTKG
jgi:hypothetical protein